MNFVEIVLDYYSHITSHVSQTFVSCTHYTSYSLLNFVLVIVCDFVEYIVIIRPCYYYVSWCNHGLLSSRSRHFATSKTDWPIFNQWPWIVLRRVAALISYFSLFYSLSLTHARTHTHMA